MLLPSGQEQVSEDCCVSSVGGVSGVIFAFASHPAVAEFGRQSGVGLAICLVFNFKKKKLVMVFGMREELCECALD